MTGEGEGADDPEPTVSTTFEGEGWSAPVPWPELHLVRAKPRSAIATTGRIQRRARSRRRIAFAEEVALL